MTQPEPTRARPGAGPTSHLLPDPDRTTILDTVSTCILVHDAVTKEILWANPAACAMLEFTLDELRPLKSTDMSSSALQYRRSVGRAWLQKAVERGHNRVQWRYRSKSGREFTTDATAVRVELATGPAVVVQFRDIEREQLLERTLVRTAGLFEALARRTVTGALVVRTDGTVEFATDSALEQFGARRDELTGDRLTEFGDFVDDDRPVTWADVADPGRRLTSVRVRTRRPADRPRWLEASVEPIATSEGVDGVMLLVHDVTARVTAQVQRERDARRENYLARYTVMGDMAMAMAHELSQPLAAASNYLAGVLGRLPAGAVPDETRFGVTGARRQVERARRIVQSLRGFVGHQEQAVQLSDLNEIVRECLYFIEIRAEAAGVPLRVALSPAPVPVRCERVLTGQVVINLCFNAIEEMEAAGGHDGAAVCIRTNRGTEESEPVGVFEVEDRGRGAVNLNFDTVFDAATTSKPGGSGIGLGLSYRIITRQQGTLRAAPAHPHGAVFSFALPAALSATPPAAPR